MSATVDQSNVQNQENIQTSIDNEANAESGDAEANQLAIQIGIDLTIDLINGLANAGMDNAAIADLLNVDLDFVDLVLAD